MLIWNVRRNWHLEFETRPNPGRDKLVGVLRTILGSIDVWGSVNPTSHGYLQYIEGFVGKLGVHLEAVSPDSLENGADVFAEESGADKRIIVL